MNGEVQYPSEDLQHVVSRLTEIEKSLAELRADRPAESASGGTGLWLLDGIDGEVPGPDGGVAHGGHVRLPDGREAGWQMTHPTGELLADDWSEYEGAIKALAHRHRLALLQELLTTPRTALQLAESGRHGTTGQIYNHLRQLVDAGWLSAASRGLYGVPTQRVIPLLVILAATRNEH